MKSLLRNLPYVKKLIALFTALDLRLDGHTARLDSLAARMDALELQVREISQNCREVSQNYREILLNSREISHNYTELTTGGLRDILEHWEKRVRDDLDIDRTQSMQELRDEIARLRSALERPPGSAARLDDGVTH